MPHNLTETSTWTTPVAAPADGDAGRQSTFDPAFQALTNRTKLLADVALGGVTSWPVAARVIKVPMLCGVRLGHDAAEDDLRLLGGGSNTPVYWVLRTNSTLLFFPLNAYLRSGETVTSIDAVCKPGAARTGVNKVSISFVSQPHAFASPATEPLNTTFSSASDDGTTNAQRITLAAINQVINLSANDYWIRVQAGNTATTFGDELYGLQVVFTDPGPRNF